MQETKDIREGLEKVYWKINTKQSNYLKLHRSGNVFVILLENSLISLLGSRVKPFERGKAPFIPRVTHE